MLGLSILFFVLAVVAGVLGFGGMAGALTSLAVIAFYVFIAFLIISLIAQAFGGVSGRGGAIGALVAIVLVCGGIYIWSQNHGNGTLRGDIKEAAANVSDAFKKTDTKAKEVVGDVSHSTKKAIDKNQSDSVN